MFYNGLSDALPQRILVETAPGAAAGTLQIDDGDIAISRQREFNVLVGFVCHLPAPKRGFKLASPVLKSVPMMVLTIRSPWPFARYCARHSTELPAPFGLTSNIPV